MIALLPGKPVSEMISVRERDGEMVIDEVPGLNTFYSLGDVVEIKRKNGSPYVANLIKSSEWSNFGIRIVEYFREDAIRILTALEKNGAIIVGRPRVMINIAVKPSEYALVYEVLEQGEERGIWTATVVINRSGQ